MVTFLIVERELVTFVATVTISLAEGDVGLMTGGLMIVCDGA